MSHFINSFMPTFICNIIFGAFNGILIYLLGNLFIFDFFALSVLHTCFLSLEICAQGAGTGALSEINGQAERTNTRPDTYSSEMQSIWPQAIEFIAPAANRLERELSSDIDTC